MKRSKAARYAVKYWKSGDLLMYQSAMLTVKAHFPQDLPWVLESIAKVT
jgi:hypothetical protein